MFNSFSPPAKPGIFHSATSSNGQKLSPLPTGNSGAQCHCSKLDIKRHFNRSLFSSSKQSSHPPTPLVMGPAEVVYRVRGRPLAAPSPLRNWAAVTGRWGASQAMCSGGSLWPGWYWFKLATSISPRITVTPLSYIT